jgi:hypothetical protein
MLSGAIAAGRLLKKAAGFYFFARVATRKSNVKKI